MELKTEFRIKFKDGKLGNWDVKLRTNYPTTNEDVQDLIEYWAEINSRNAEVYSPVDILDDLCEDKGWTWEDGDLEDVYIVNW